MSSAFMPPSRVEPGIRIIGCLKVSSNASIKVFHRLYVAGRIIDL